MPTYETLFIASPNLSEEEEASTIETMAQVIADGGGAMVTNDRVGRRRLAYPIMKFQDGIYVRFLYDCETSLPRELERRLRLSDKVLRSLTVRLEPDWAVESKKQVIRDAEARAEAAVRQAEQEAAALAAGLVPGETPLPAGERFESEPAADAEDSDEQAREE